MNETLDNPCFTFEPAGEGESVSDIARRLFAQDGRFHLSHIESVVPDGYGSPYRFGNLLREIIGDDNAEVFRAGRIYFVWGERGLATYDPSKRPGALPEVDFFAAVDQLA